MSTQLEPVLPPSLEDFGFPLCLVFSKQGEAYLSERITGRLWQIDHEKYRLIKTFSIVPLVGHHETGLLGIALDPDFEKKRYIYCYFTAGTSQKDFKNRVVRVKDDGKEEILLDNIPAGMIHNGGIIAFAPDKTLYIGVGVQDEIKEKAQDTKWLGGKVLRINRDGSIPKDNPFSNSPVYSYGHRNIFGLAFHPKTGKLYISDVGPEKNDEINIIEKGSNYGWPDVMGMSENKRFINPIQTYDPTITPTQNVFVGNDLYFASFNEGSVHKLTFSGKNYDQVEKDEVVYKGKPWGANGVFYGPDEQFYVTTQDKIIRFTPEKVINPIIKAAKQGLNFPLHFIEGHLETSTKSIKDLKLGEGAIVEVQGQKVAAYKKSEKETITLSPVCKHMGCIVGWNDKDKTWDCPCHGSRYAKEGKVIQGPAEKDLDKKTF